MPPTPPPAPPGAARLIAMDRERSVRSGGTNRRSDGYPAPE